MLDFLIFIGTTILNDLLSGVSGSSSNEHKNKKITYGFNAKGEYVPKSIGDDKIC